MAMASLCLIMTHSLRFGALLLFLQLACGMAALQAGNQPNPPQWPDSVQVFSPGDPTIQAKVNAAFAVNGGHSPPNHGQFSSSRYAFLFKPGTYTADVPVGYYTHIVGLGDTPDDVVFAGDKGVYCEEGDYFAAAGALDTFWRAAENFRTQSAHKWNTVVGMLWAVSQAAPLRRVHVDNGLSLYEYQPPYPAAGYSSGGFLANSRVEGIVYSGSQQQFMTRNSELVGGWNGGVWNMVFSGVAGAPAGHCGNSNNQHPFTVLPTTPSIAEKPYITFSSTSNYVLNIPKLKSSSSGTEWSSTVQQVPFESVYVANNATDTADTINKALSTGLHVVLTPGIYTLTDSLQVVHEGQVLLGLGFPTLVPGTGKPVIEVGNVDNVRIAGPFLLQAGTQATPALMQWGDGTYAGDASAPGAFYDVFARVGGPDVVPVQAHTMVRIDSGNVIGDNMWFWRADHTVSGIVKNSDNPVQHGLVVSGDDVTMYGLACEHTLADLTQWSGNGGRTVFYQSELPYDVTQANFGDQGYTSYRVNSTVTSHEAYGVGVYTFFRDYNVTVQSGIVTPPAVASSFVNPLGVYLSGKGIMDHVINDNGATTGWNANRLAYVCT